MNMIKYIKTSLKTFWNDFKPQAYYSLFIAITISGLDFIIRWDAYVERASYLLLRAGAIKTVCVYVAIFFLLVFTVFILRCTYKLGHFFWGYFVGIAMAINYLYLAVMDDFLNPRDLTNIIKADMSLVGDAFITFFSLKGLLILVVLIGSIYGSNKVIKRLKGDHRRTFSLGVSIVLITICTLTQFQVWSVLYVKLNKFPVDGVSHLFRTISFTVLEYNEFYAIDRDEAEINVNQLNEPNKAKHIVYIIDELIRYDYLGVNNTNLNTTPFLSRLKDPKFHNLGLTVSASTCSFQTRSLLLTGVNQVPDTSKHILSRPTLFQFAKKHQYNTVLINAANNTNFPNIVFREKDMAFVDEYYQVKDLSPINRFTDFAAIEIIHDALQKEVPQFIVLIKKGAHFHYEAQYPKASSRFAYFSPHLDRTDSYDASRKKMVNSYKNTILFTVDHFFEALLKEIPPNITVLYTADHGQTLQDQGQSYTHCKYEIEQAIVPTFLYSDHRWVTDIKHKYGKQGSPILSHHQLFPSLLALMSGDRESQHNGYRSLFSKENTQEKLKYSTGGLWSFSDEVTVNKDDIQKFIIPNNLGK